MDQKISVIIPTHFRNEMLREAIDSVLRQEYDPLELIVVDDSGEGHAEPVFEEYDEVQGIIREENGGWAAAYTTGIEASTGDYIHFLDDDDYFLEGKLRKTAEVLRENPDVGVSYCGVIWGDEGKFYPRPNVSGDVLEEALAFKAFPAWTGSMLMEREVLIDCMPLPGMGEDDELEIELGDTDLKIELARRTKFDYVDECLVYYRRGTNKLWHGARRIEKVKQNIRYREELYDQYPEIRAELLASWYQKHGEYLLEERFWSPKAVLCFLKSIYYTEGAKNKAISGVGGVASVFGLPGWRVAKRVRSTVGTKA